MRLATVGFETGSLGELTAWNPSSTYITLDATVKRTGSYALKSRAWFGGDTQGWFQIAIPASSEIYFRIAFYMTGGFANGDHEGLLYFEDSEGGKQILIKYLGAGQTLAIYVGDNLVASGTIIYSAEVFYVLQGYIKLDASDGAVIVKCNNVTDAAFAGNTLGTALGTLVNLSHAAGVGGTDYVYFDDIAINDTTGAFENSWVGNGGVKLLKSVGDGSSSEWNLSGGSDHYALVDEVPRDNNTTYIYDDVAGHRDLFILEDLNTVVDSIALIEPLFQAALTETGSANVKHVVRHDGANYDGDTEVITSVQPAYVLNKSGPIYEVLGGSGAWSGAQVNALESGVEVA